MNIYLELTRRFNQGRLRAVLAGGQAVVLHRLAIMSKDGDWILREDGETLRHVLSVLSEYGAVYRFGAPLDERWLTGGWSSHLEFLHGNIRVRTDFVTRPPRLDASALRKLWDDQAGRDLPWVGACELAELKKTRREKDYAVIGELARVMTETDAQMLHSRSARDLIRLTAEHRDRLPELTRRRPVLGTAGQDLSAWEAALDAERRHWMHADEERLAKYMTAAERWAEMWPEVAREIDGKHLADAHRILAKRAEGCLPFQPTGGGG